MLKRILATALALACVLVLCSFDVAPANTVSKPVLITPTEEIAEKVLESRFLNMLNHNYAFNDDFLSDERLVNHSALALLNMVEEQFINEAYVKDYIFNMYGKVINDFSGFNADFPQKAGYIYVIPRCYDLYKHSVLSVTDNSDGSFTVVTEVEISLLDGSIETATATSLFLKNSDSQFGFNLLYCDSTQEETEIC